MCLEVTTISVFVLHVPHVAAHSDQSLSLITQIAEAEAPKQVHLKSRIASLHSGIIDLCALLLQSLHFHNTKKMMTITKHYKEFLPPFLSCMNQTATAAALLSTDTEETAVTWRRSLEKPSAKQKATRPHSRGVTSVFVGLSTGLFLPFKR